VAPTITNGESVTINYAAYATVSPRRWDVVVLRPPAAISNYATVSPRFRVVKRIIALPSETVSLTSSGIVVNGTFLTMPARLSNVVYCSLEKLWPPSGGFVPFPYTVPSNHYFVIGDNWTNSLDSREYGAVPLTNIMGRVLNK
jgi:signal peptidase I